MDRVIDCAIRAALGGIEEGLDRALLRVEALGSPRARVAWLRLLFWIDDDTQQAILTALRASRPQGAAVLIGVVDLEGAAGGARADETQARRFAMDPPGNLRAADGACIACEQALQGSGGRLLPHLPGMIAYWFSWRGAVGSNQ